MSDQQPNTAGDYIYEKITEERIQHLEAENQMLQDQIGRIKLLIKDEENHMRVGFGGYDLPNHVDRVLMEQRDAAANALSQAKAFRDDILVLLRALALLVETVDNSATHGEKHARCRALSELLEGGIGRLRQTEFEYARCLYWPDVFRADYPSRHFVQRIHELEGQVEVLNRELAKRQDSEAQP